MPGAARPAAPPPLAKAFRVGTHRSRDPAATLRRILPALRHMGITRLARLTGLDDLGIPVCAAIRPNAHSVAVAQGKGLTDAAAAASAAMEAIEVFHAENLDGRARLAAIDELAAKGADALTQGVNRTRKPLSRKLPIRWLQGTELGTGQSCWVPFELVSTDYRLPRAPDAGLFLASTNGLASGNHLVEAMVAGLCELVERDAAALHAARSTPHRAARLLDTGTVDDPTCRRLLETLKAARMQVLAWDITSDLGVASFLCRLSDGPREPWRRIGAFRGHGCHPDRRVALCRAITEAAQARLTRISGTRDDLHPRDFTQTEALPVWDALAALRPPAGALQSFAAVPSFEADDIEADLAFLVGQLRRHGLPRIVAVDLTRPEFGIPVVRVVVPGLEAPDDHPDCVTGTRVAAVRAAEA